MKIIKSRLRILMAEQEPPINQAQLIKATGLSSTTISKIFNNNFSRIDKTTLEVLLTYFDCDLKDILIVVDVE